MRILTEVNPQTIQPMDTRSLPKGSFRLQINENHEKKKYNENPKRNKAKYYPVKTKNEIEYHENSKESKTLTILTRPLTLVEYHENSKESKTSNRSTNEYTVNPRRELPLTGHRFFWDLQVPSNRSSGGRNPEDTSGGCWQPR